MYFDEKIETMPRSAMEELQSQRLQQTIKWVQEKSGFYQKKFADSKVALQDIEVIQDLNKLPFTTKEELIANAPLGMLTLEMNSVVRIEPIESLPPLVMAYTWAYIILIFFILARF